MNVVYYYKRQYASSLLVVVMNDFLIEAICCAGRCIANVCGIKFIALALALFLFGNSSSHFYQDGRRQVQHVSLACASRRLIDHSIFRRAVVP